MLSLQDAFHQGGWPMYPILMSGVLLLLAAGRFALRPERRSVPLLAALGLVTLLWGAVGFTLGLICSLSAIKGVPPELRYIVLVGLGESLNDLALALLLLLMGGMLAAVGAYRHARGARPVDSTVPASG